MRLYLVQHGHAVSEDEDPLRPLSEWGRTEVGRVASFLAGARVHVARVIHSGKARARDSALLLAEALGPGRVVEEANFGLAPNDSSGALADAIAGWTEDVMVVGHMPFMGRMVSRLVADAEGNPLTRFQPGAVVCLEREAGGDGWTIAWMVTPDLVGGVPGQRT